MKRRMLSILTVLALCLGMLPGTAEAAAPYTTRLDFTNVGTEEGQTPASGDGYIWDAESNTLTLDGLNMVIDDPDAIPSKLGAITLPEDSVLVLEGTSSITIQVKQNQIASSIRYNQALTIKGTGTLNLNLNGQNNLGIYCGSDSDWKDSSLCLENGEINITASQDVGNTEGIRAGKVTLCGANLNIKNVTYGIGGKDNKGIETVEISDGSLTISCDKDGANDYSGIVLSYPYTTTSSLSITGGTVDISGVFKAIDFGKGTVTVSGGTLDIHDLMRNSSGYSWALRGQVSDAEPQIKLIGGNINFSECVEWISFVGSVPAGAIQVNDEFGLSGLIGIYRVEQDGRINQNEVRVYGDYTLHESISFSEYQAGIWVIDMAPDSTLTIPEGMEFDMSGLNRHYDSLAPGHDRDSIDLSGGTIVNDGTLKFPETIDKDQLAEWDIIGSGTITIGDNTPLYYVTFDSQGGSSVSKQVVISGETASEPSPEPTKSCYTFEGWYTDAEGTAPFDFSTPVTETLTLYAKWSEIAVTGVTLNKTSLELAVGGTEQLTAIIAPDDATDKTVTWASDNPTVATVDGSGNVTAVGAGTAVITVTTTDGNETAACVVTVAVPVIRVTGVTLNKTSLELTVGGTEQLTAIIAPDDATDKTVTWASGDPAVATVDGSGNVTALSAGTTVVTVTTTDGNETAACVVTVAVPVIRVTGVTLNKTSLELTVGDTEQLTAIIAPDDATDKTVTWASGDPAVATVDGSGNVTAFSAGTAIITVTTTDGNETAACVVTVAAPVIRVTGVTLNKTSLELAVGGTEQLTVIIAPDGATDKTVTWASGDPAVATVDGSGNVTALSAGTAAVTVTTTDGGKSAVCLVTVRTSSSGGSSGGNNGSNSSSGSNSYAVTIEKSEHGKVTSSHASASSNSTVTLTVIPDSGYALDTLTVTDSRGNEIHLTAQGGGKYAFTMPNRDVTVKATFTPLPEDVEQPCDGGADCPSRGFTDLGTAGAWYHEAVDYVLRSGLMGGYSGSLFGPDDNLSRAQLAQILYNKEGRPFVTGGSVFTDVSAGKWYVPAITWAAANGIAGGYGGGLFGPDDNITREQLAVMLWRYAGSPAATGQNLRFTDVDQASGYALEALRWATETGILSGYGDGRLNPAGLATRAQVAQMLKNYMNR